MSQSLTDIEAENIGLSTGSPMEELEGGLEEVKGFAVPWEE